MSERASECCGGEELTTRCRLGLSSSFGATPRTGIEKERQDAREMLEGWLRDVPGAFLSLLAMRRSGADFVRTDTFIVVTGPRGSGKTGLIEEVIAADAKYGSSFREPPKEADEDRRNVLNIDCAEICKNSRTDTKLVSVRASLRPRSRRQLTARPTPGTCLGCGLLAAVCPRFEPQQHDRPCFHGTDRSEGGFLIDARRSAEAGLFLSLPLLSSLPDSCRRSSKSPPARSRTSLWRRVPERRKRPRRPSRSGSMRESGRSLWSSYIRRASRMGGSMPSPETASSASWEWGSKRPRMRIRRAFFLSRGVGGADQQVQDHHRTEQRVVRQDSHGRGRG